MSLALKIFLLGLLCSWILLVGLHLGGIIDDAYIYCRYADNLVEGHGFVFNRGERVEGNTSFLQTILLSLLITAGMDGRMAAMASSFLAGMGVVFLVLTMKEKEPFTNFIRTAILCCSFPFLIWSSSGMDECLLLAVVILLMRSAEKSLMRNGFFSCTDWFIAGLAFASRPEGILIYFSLLIVSVAGLKDHFRETIKGVIAGAIPVLLLTVFRYAYFGSLLPNTFQAKAGGVSLDLFMRGFLYVLGAVIGLLPLIVMGAWGMIEERKNKYGQLAMTMSSLFLLGSIYVGGDAFPWYRFVLPIVPILSVFAAPPLRRMRPDSTLRHLIVPSFLVILLGWTASPANPFANGSEMDRYLFARKQALTWDLIGRELPVIFGPHRSLALTPIGAIGYRSRWTIIDMVGLTDVHIAHRSMPLGKGIAGHEKFDADYVLAKKPDFILLHTWLWPARPPIAALGPQLGMAAEKIMYQNPVFIRDYRPLIVPVQGKYLVIFSRKEHREIPRPG